MTKVEAKNTAVELAKAVIASQNQAAPVNMDSSGANSVADFIETLAGRLEKMF